jgi:hypothetical protein
MGFVVRVLGTAAGFVLSISVFSFSQNIANTRRSSMDLVQTLGVSKFAVEIGFLTILFWYVQGILGLCEPHGTYRELEFLP